MVFWW